MIPDLIDIGGVWKVLTPGIHDATLSEVELHFATNEKRRKLYEGLLRSCQYLAQAGCSVIYLDGSFITSKTLPNDFDVCWDLSGVDASKLDKVFLDFDDHRKKQKQKYGGEFFPTNATADGLHTFLNFFQIDKDTGKKKGIIRIQLK